VQFPSDAAAIVKQGAQSLLGCRESRGKAGFDLSTQQASQRLNCVVGNPLSERRRLLQRLARGWPKPVDNLETPPIFYQLEHPF
jgi:hypothetical protein